MGRSARGGLLAGLVAFAAVVASAEDPYIESDGTRAIKAGDYLRQAAMIDFHNLTYAIPGGSSGRPGREQDSGGQAGWSSGRRAVARCGILLA